MSAFNVIIIKFFSSFLLNTGITTQDVTSRYPSLSYPLPSEDREAPEDTASFLVNKLVAGRSLLVFHHRNGSWAYVSMEERMGR